MSDLSKYLRRSDAEARRIFAAMVLRRFLTLVNVVSTEPPPARRELRAIAEALRWVPPDEASVRAAREALDGFEADPSKDPVWLLLAECARAAADTLDDSMRAERCAETLLAAVGRIAVDGPRAEGREERWLVEALRAAMDDEPPEAAPSIQISEAARVAISRGWSVRERAVRESGMRLLVPTPWEEVLLGVAAPGASPSVRAIVHAWSEGDAAAAEDALGRHGERLVAASDDAPIERRRRWRTLAFLVNTWASRWLQAGPLKRHGVALAELRVRDAEGWQAVLTRLQEARAEALALADRARVEAREALFARAGGAGLAKASEVCTNEHDRERVAQVALLAATLLDDETAEAIAADLAPKVAQLTLELTELGEG
ncbi:MAG: hypothetical protein AAGH15_15175 [Myxococcota bacterium]